MSKNAGALTVVGFVAAVLVALLVVPVGHCFALSVGLSARGTCAGTFAAFSLFGSVIAFPSALVFGAPIYFVFRKLGWLSWWQVPTGAGLAGVLAAVALHGFDGTTNLPGTVGMFGGLGAVAGVAFWCFTLRRHEP